MSLMFVEKTRVTRPARPPQYSLGSCLQNRCRNCPPHTEDAGVDAFVSTVTTTTPITNIPGDREATTPRYAKVPRNRAGTNAQ